MLGRYKTIHEDSRYNNSLLPHWCHSRSCLEWKWNLQSPRSLLIQGDYWGRGGGCLEFACIKKPPKAFVDLKSIFFKGSNSPYCVFCHFLKIPFLVFAVNRSCCCCFRLSLNQKFVRRNFWYRTWNFNKAAVILGGVALLCSHTVGEPKRKSHFSSFQTREGFVLGFLTKCVPWAGKGWMCPSVKTVTAGNRLPPAECVTKTMQFSFFPFFSFQNNS